MRASVVPSTLALAGALLLTTAATAPAADRAVRGGTGTLTLDAGLRRSAKSGDVGIRASGGASVGTTRAVLPVRSGMVDPGSRGAQVALRGTLRFAGRRAGASASWTSLSVRGGKRWTLRARVGGSGASVVVATAARQARLRTTSSVVVLSPLDLRLSAVGGRALRRAGVTSARKGTKLGTLALRLRAPAGPAGDPPPPPPPPAPPATGRRATFRLDPGTQAALSSARTQVRPVPPGGVPGADAGPEVTVPVTGGQIDAASKSGAVDLAGRIAVSGDGSDGATFDSLELELGVVPVLTGTGTGSGLAGRSAPFSADLGSATFTRTGQTVTATGILLRFTPAMVQLVNRAAGRPVVQIGTPWAMVDLVLPD